jgi:hypothetical protein
LPVAPAIPSLFSTMFDFLFCVLFVHTVIYSARNYFILSVYIILLKKKTLRALAVCEAYRCSVNFIIRATVTLRVVVPVTGRFTVIVAAHDYMPASLEPWHGLPAIPIVILALFASWPPAVLGYHIPLFAFVTAHFSLTNLNSFTQNGGTHVFRDFLVGHQSPVTCLLL